MGAELFDAFLRQVNSDLPFLGFLGRWVACTADAGSTFSPHLEASVEQGGTPVSRLRKKSVRFCEVGCVEWAGWMDAWGVKEEGMEENAVRRLAATSAKKHGENAPCVAFSFQRVLLQTHLTEAKREKKRKREREREPNVFDVQRWDGGASRPAAWFRKASTREER
jgi:hypothetical protein